MIFRNIIALDSVDEEFPDPEFVLELVNLDRLGRFFEPALWLHQLMLHLGATVINHIRAKKGLNTISLKTHLGEHKPAVGSGFRSNLVSLVKRQKHIFKLKKLIIETLSSINIKDRPNSIYLVRRK